MATLTQQNARLNRRLEKVPARQTPDGGQANSSGSILSPRFPAENLPRQNATPSAEETRKTMRSIKDIRRKHRNNGGMVPLRSNCKKEVSTLNDILKIHRTRSTSQIIEAEFDEDDAADHIFRGAQGSDLERLGKALRPFLSGLGVVEHGNSKPNMSKGRANVQVEKKMMAKFGKGTEIRTLLMVRCFVSRANNSNPHSLVERMKFATYSKESSIMWRTRISRITFPPTGML